MTEQPAAIIHFPNTMTQDQMSDFAERFKEAHSKNASTYALPQALPGGYFIDSYANPDLIGHGGHCGPRCRPLRAWFGLSVWKFKGCNRDFGMGGFCERRYVWDQGRWARLLSDRAIQRLEEGLGLI